MKLLQDNEMTFALVAVFAICLSGYGFSKLANYDHKVWTWKALWEGLEILFFMAVGQAVLISSAFILFWEKL